MAELDPNTNPDGQVDPNEIDPNEIDPNEIDPNEIDPNEIDPNEIDPNEIDPNEIDPPTRGQQRQQRLANERNQEREARIHAEAEAKLLREQAAFYQRQAEALQQQQQRPVTPAEPEYIDPDEKWRRETQLAMNRGLAQQADLADRANFTLAAVKDPLKAKLMDKVEAEVQKLRSQGNMQVTREGLFHYLLGVETAANYGKKTPTAAAAEQRVARARTTPAPSRSDVAKPAGGKSLEARLLDQLL